MKIYNTEDLKENRRKLRNNMTKEEIILWKLLKNKQLENAKFRRQYSIDNYIVDFYCADLHLAIELDGGHHYDTEVMEYDKMRDDYIRSLNIDILRFTNLDTKRNLDGVVEMIRGKIKEKKNLPGS